MLLGRGLRIANTCLVEKNLGKAMHGLRKKALLGSIILSHQKVVETQPSTEILVSRESIST